MSSKPYMPIAPYVPLPHMCFHQFESDRLRVQNQGLVDEVLQRDRDLKDAQRQLRLASVKASINQSILQKYLEKKGGGVGDESEDDDDTDEGDEGDEEDDDDAEEGDEDEDGDAGDGDEDEDGDDVLVKRAKTSGNKETKGEDVKLTVLQFKEELVRVFSGIKEIGDIIAIKDHPRCEELCENVRFARLVHITDHLHDLDSMVGLDSIKQQLLRLILHYSMHGRRASEDLMHITIEGPPGVGKSQVARIIGKIVASLRILPKGVFVVARRSDLVGEFLGQTAVKTQKVIDKARGGVLFIDEAYSLGHANQRDSFSKECIDTLTHNLTERRGRFLCIIAGYKEDLETCFFSANKGLERRFPVRLSIEKYTGRELFEILESNVVREKWLLTNKREISGFIEENATKFYHFGGDIESLFRQAKLIASHRLFGKTISTPRAKLRTITLDDVKEAYALNIGKRSLESTTPPSMMYI